MIITTFIVILKRLLSTLPISLARSFIIISDIITDKSRITSMDINDKNIIDTSPLNQSDISMQIKWLIS